MAILYIDNVIIYKETNGIDCPNCGGKPKKRSLTIIAKTLRLLTLGYIKLHCYECTNCQKTLNLF